MWLNNKEESTFGPFQQYINKNEDKDFLFEYEDGSKLKVQLHLYEYESDNGLDSNAKNYEEYWEMAFEIVDVLQDDKNKYNIGDKVLVNYHTIPKKYSTV